MDDRHYLRLKQRLQDIIHCIHTFPDSNQLFTHSNLSNQQQPIDHVESSIEVSNHTQLLPATAEANRHPTPGEGSNETTRAIDITEALDTVRSRFKILITQLNSPELNLHDVMNRSTIEGKTSDVMNSVGHTKETRPLIYDDW